MYTQYQQYNQYQRQQQEQEPASTERGMLWNGNSWVSHQPGRDGSSSSLITTMYNGSAHHSFDASYQQQQPQPQPQQLQVPSNPVLTYTQYYHSWKAHGETLRQRLQSLSQYSSHDGTPQQEQDRVNLENEMQWAKYYSDESSRAAHHFHQNPLATSAPFDLPPAPPDAAASTATLPAGGTNQNHPGSKGNVSRGEGAQRTGEDVPPGSLTRYVKRSVEQYQHDDEKKKLVQREIEKVIALAIQSGTLQTTNWDIVPSVQLPSSTSIETTGSSDRMAAHPRAGVVGVAGAPLHYQQHEQNQQQQQQYQPQQKVYQYSQQPPQPQPQQQQQQQQEPNYHGNYYVSTASSLKQKQEYGHYGRSDVDVNGVGTRQMEQTPSLSLPSGGGNYYGPASDSRRHHHDYSASSSSPFSTSPNNYYSQQASNDKNNKRVHRSMVSDEHDLPHREDDEDFLALPRAHKGNRRDSNAGKANNSRKKMKVFQGDASTRDGVGWDASDHALAQRADRFSGRGGTTDVAASNRATIGNEHDKYMGKRLIGGNNVTLDEYDYEQMTVKGTCATLEKDYLRLTAPPRAELVRPLAVLQLHLKNLKLEYYGHESNETGSENMKEGSLPRIPRQRRHDYLWFCSQLKAVRQDCTVQRIQGDFAVNIYETHARIALEEGDLNEYNQCQTQLKELYKANVPGGDKSADKATDAVDGNITTSKTWEHQDEFIAYRLLYYVFLGTNEKYGGGSSDMFQIMLSLSPSQKTHPAILHALQVREAVAFNDYLWFFRLHKRSPNLGRFLTGLMVPTIRMRGLRRIVKAYRPSFELNVCLQYLGFESSDECDDEGKNWLISCGCVVEGSTIVTKDTEVLESSEMTSSSLI